MYVQLYTVSIISEKGITVLPFISYSCMLQEPVIPQYRVAMTVPRLGDLPEPVLELLVMLGETLEKQRKERCKVSPCVTPPWNKDVFGGCGLWLYPGAIKRCGYCSRILWNPAFFIILLGDLPATPGRLCPSSIVDPLALSIPFDCTLIFAYKLSRLLGEHAAKSFRAHFDGNAAAEVQLLYMTWLDYSCHHPKQT